ncbi:MAG: methyltransferase [Coriobacteriia bacterium]|nr:methyltransferase [Coriobacteriia bacterium]
MRTIRENAEAILAGDQPDYYFDFMYSMTLVPDPEELRSPKPKRGGEEVVDEWGVTYQWPEGAQGPQPVARPETLAIPDIQSFAKHLIVPDVYGADWTETKRQADAVDREEKYVAIMSGCGLFERSHTLMGLENALRNYLLSPDKVWELLNIIKDYKIAYLEEAAVNIQPDVVFYHDDWGHKRNVFLPPDIWRKMIKPLHAEIVAKAHELGIFFLHHADCILEPLVMDMVDMGIDAWQGVIAQNDILEIQRVTKGRLAMIGGFDSYRLDTSSTTEADIRAEVRRVIDTYCPAGRFFPGIPNGILYTPGLMSIYLDEMASYGREWALKNPMDKFSDEALRETDYKKDNVSLVCAVA